MKTLIERFEAKISPEPMSGCWLWTASTDGGGYGHIRINKQLLKAPRVSYELFKGIIPPGLCVCHKCDTPACVNPDHLFLGTQKANAIDKVRKGRMVMGTGNAPDLKRKQTHCIHGHIFDVENTYFRKRGGRSCRKCGTAAVHKYNRRKKAMVA